MTEVTSAKDRGINPPHSLVSAKTSGHQKDGIRTNYAFRFSGLRQGKGQNPMMNSVTVSAELGLSLVVPEHGAVPLVASVDFSASDPYAIKIAFHVGTDEPVEWIFARELLAAGIERPAGEGDVQVWPGDAESDVLNIALSSPFGQAHFEAPLSSVAEFLKSTYGIVPTGSESDFIDLDGELDDLLWQA